MPLSDFRVHKTATSLLLTLIHTLSLSLSLACSEESSCHVVSCPIGETHVTRNRGSLQSTPREELRPSVQQPQELPASRSFLGDPEHQGLAILNDLSWYSLSQDLDFSLRDPEPEDPAGSWPRENVTLYLTVFKALTFGVTGYTTVNT